MSNDLQDLEKVFRLFPGIGPRTAKRYSKIFMNFEDAEKTSCIDVLQRFVGKTSKCAECGNFSNAGLCQICSEKESRDTKLLCIVENIEDIEIIEKSNSFNGLYIVTNGLVSIGGRKKEKFFPDCELIRNRIRNERVEEVLFSFKYSVEAQVTMEYITEKIRKEFQDLSFSILNFGIPAGIDISLIDSQSLGESIRNRRVYGQK